MVFDGEVVEEEAAPGAPLTPPVRAALRAAGRHLGYVAAGTVVAVRRRRRKRTFMRQMAELESARGNADKALEWARQDHQQRRERAEQRRAALQLAGQLLVMLPRVVLGAAVALVALSVLMVVAGRPAAVTGMWRLAGSAAVAAYTAGTVTWGLLPYAVPVAAAAWLWHLGRAAGGDLAPSWSVAARPGGEDRGLVVTADTIVLALQNLPVPQLVKAFKDKWQPSFTLQPVRDGRGYEAEFSLPLGVTAEMIADRRAVLARNLHREEIETWPSAGRPGYARLWVADPGAIGTAAPEYPLLHEGQADVFQGVPGGVLARGDGADIPVVAANGVLGGLMGQGKSNAGRVVVLGCCTDPLCGVDVFVFANNGDFDAYEPRLALYRRGLDDDVIDDAMERLHEAYRDVGEREQVLADLGAKKVTRKLAQKYPELRPHVSLFSECHELFGSERKVGKVTVGELAGELAVKIVKRQRKTGRAAWFDTQSSRKAAIPPALVELVSVNCCFAVKSWRSNDGFLGDGSFAAGIRATELRPGRDRGTSLVTGISDAQFELLRWYFIEVDDDTGYDAARPVIERSMREVDPRTPVAGSAPVAITVRDLLGDLAEVLAHRSGRVRVSELPDLLHNLAPSWGAYAGLTVARLREQLLGEGVRTTNPGNVPTLDLDDLAAAIRQREVS